MIQKVIASQTPIARVINASSFENRSEYLLNVNLRSWHRNSSSVSKGTMHRINIRERKGPCPKIIQKCALHERRQCAPQFGERLHEETSIHERCSRKTSGDYAKIFTSTRIERKLCFVFLIRLNQCKRQQMWTPITQENRIPRIQSRFKSIGALDEQGRL